jgi:DNA-binding SARP family transcriptional activator
MLFRSAVDQMGTTIFAVWTNAHRLALVQALLATDQPDEALREIRIVQAFARRGVSTHYHWMSQMGEADALLRLGRSRECDQVLAQALVLGRSKGLYSLPLAPDNALAPLLDRALTLGIENDYVRALAKRHRVRPTSTESDAWPWRIKVYVLGSFRLLIDDRPMTYGRKAQRRPLELLQAIVAHDGHDVPLATLAEALWPEADGDAADHALDVTALRLRRLLGEPPALQLANRRASLVDEHCWTDVGALKHALALLEPALHPTAPPLTDEALRVLHRCLALYRGPLLATETDAPWMLEARARYRMLIAHAFAAAARNLQTAGREADAQRLCTQLLERDAGTARWLPDWARRDGELTARTASARTAASYGRP